MMLKYFPMDVTIKVDFLEAAALSITPRARAHAPEVDFKLGCSDCKHIYKRSDIFSAQAHSISLT